MRKPLSLFTLLLFAVVSFAQSKIEVQAPNLVSVDEQFNVTFVIEGSAPTDFQWSAGADFQLVWGPQKGSMTRHSNINGNVSNSTQTTYTYILLAKAEGKFNLPTARATVDGRNVQSSTTVIEVVSAGNGSNSVTSARRYGSSQRSQSSSSSGGGSSQSGSGSTGNRSEGSSTSQGSTSLSNDDIYLRLELSKTNAVVGEAITATLKLYQRVNLVGFENIKLPTFNGFWSQERRSPTTLDFQRENVNGKIYNVAVVRSWSLVPQRAGKLVIEPTEMVSVINMRVNRSSSSGSVFDEFFQTGYQRVRKRISTGTVTVNVENLPSGAPASFGGGVGNYSMSASLSRSELSVNDAASLEIRITGTGSMALISAPEVNFPPDFEVYDVKVTDISGGKLFEYPFIPRSRGEFTIDPVYYSYYNLDSRSYVTMNTEPLQVSVSRGSGSESDSSSGGGVVSSVQRRDVKDVNSDIRFIDLKTPSFVNAGVFFVGSLAFWLVILGLCVLALFTYYQTKLNRKRKADVVRIKTMGAVKLARKRLSIAENFLKDAQYSAFYEELHKALVGYVADRFNMDIADMNRENICAEFEKRNVAEDVVNKYIELTDACEYARYSPDSGEAMSVHYESAVEVISMLESDIRHNMKKSKKSTLPLIALMLMLMPQFALASESEELASKSASPVELWNSGVEAYQNGKWLEAIEAWNGIIEAGLVSKELYYNLGNAYYKIQDVAHAVLCYERALKLNPSYADARFNLQLTSNLVQDKIEAVPEFFLGRWLRNLSCFLTSTTWAVIGLILFALSLFSILVFLLAVSRGKRIIGFSNGIVTFILAIFVFFLAFYQKANYLKDNSAIIVAAVSVVKSSPSDSSSKELFVLHEGTKVKIIDELGSWKNIEIADGRQGWMKSSDMELI